MSEYLYTRNPEDIMQVVPCAIEETKAQSLRDVGVELLPFEEHEGSLTDSRGVLQLAVSLAQNDDLSLMWSRSKYDSFRILDLMTNFNVSYDKE